jgi:hypothetical protein
MEQMTFSPRLDTVASLTDRCDGCGAAAKLAVAMLPEGDLAFCGHHANQHAQTILRHAGQISVLDGFGWHGLPADVRP